MAKMSVEEVWELVVYRGDARVPQTGQNDLHTLTVETIHQLPRNVQNWLLCTTCHIFIGGHGQPGQYCEVAVPFKEVENELIKVRIIFLSERLMNRPAEEAMRTVAVEVGYSWLSRSRRKQHPRGFSYEEEIYRLVTKWGFVDARLNATGEGPKTVRAKMAAARSRKPKK